MHMLAMFVAWSMMLLLMWQVTWTLLLLTVHGEEGQYSQRI